MEFLHVGFAVKDIHRSAALYRDLFGMRFEPVREYALTTQHEGRDNPIRVLVTHGFTTSGVEFEMVQSLSGVSSDSLVLGDREGLSHMAFRVDDLPAERARLQARGLEPIYTFASDQIDYEFFAGPDLAGILIQLVCFHVPRGDAHIGDTPQP